MWTDIFLKNKKHVIKTLDDFIRDLEKFRTHIKKGNINEIFQLLKRTKVIRKSILKAHSLKK